MIKQYGFYFYMIIVLILVSCVKIADKNTIESEPELVINIYSHNRILKLAIDSAQKVIRDSIKVVNNKVQYWSSYETGLPTGTIKKMNGYNRTKYKLEYKTATDAVYGIITIRKKNGELTSSTVSYNQYITMNPEDKIR